MTTNAVWFAVVGAGDRVLGVYGSELLQEAECTAVKVKQQTGLGARIETVTGRRPSVGEGFPWCDICRGEPDRREGSNCYGCDRPSSMGGG